MKEWFGMKKKSRRRRAYRSKATVQRDGTKKTKNSTRSSNIVTKTFEIFVTDFLTDPCGLPMELKDYVLVDGTLPLNDGSGLIRRVP
jgi:hypothetical protein